MCPRCSRSNTKCSWNITSGLARTADLEDQVVEAERHADDLKVLVSAMRFGTDEGSEILLEQLRMGAEVVDLAHAIRAGSGEPDDKGV